MNPWMISDLADSHVREIRRQAAEYRAGALRTGARRSGARPVHDVNRWLRLRHRVGFGLVEAGLHVLATTKPAP
jgi:hypothetical protein